MVALPRKKWTEEEYLAMERASRRDKREYYDGDIYTMVGGTPTHSQISGNLVTTLNMALEDRPCRVYTSDLKIKTQQDYFYPDVSVVCGDLQFAPNTHTAIINPLLIIEVLSPSTDQFDRGQKFHRYQTLESLQEYLLIAQDRPCVEQFARKSPSYWMYAKFEGLDTILEIPSLTLRLPLAAIYRKITFEPLEDDL